MHTTRLTDSEQAMAARHIEFVIPRLTSSGYVEQTECAACHLTYPCDAVTSLATIAALREKLAAWTDTFGHISMDAGEAGRLTRDGIAQREAKLAAR